jgi:ribonuclease D
MSERPASRPPLTDPGEVAELAGKLQAAGTFALDLEFVSESRYIPELCLVQVGWGPTEAPEVAALDPLAVDVGPVVALVGDPGVRTVLHAATADLALLAHHFGIQPAHVLDSQVAAAFLGIGDQIGYGNLVEALLGLRLDKGAQFTDWRRRPLSPQQLAYALDDVRYLHQLWPRLEARLRERGRFAWAEEETARVARAAVTRLPPEEAYRKVKGWNELHGKSLGALAGAAAWRERLALADNKPPSWIAQDRSLFDLARRIPPDVRALAEQRGIREGLAYKHGAELLAALRQGAADPPPSPPRFERLPAKAEVWTVLLSGIVAARAKETGIAPRYLAARDEVERLVRWWLDGDRENPPSDLAVLAGWRREIAGGALLAWLKGEAQLVIDEASEVGVRMVGEFLG